MDSSSGTVSSADCVYAQPVCATVPFTGFPDPATCTLTGPAASAQCTFTYTSDSGDEGSYTVAASYGGDTYHLPSGPSNTQSFIVTTGTSISIACSPSSIDWNAATESCTATITSADSGDS